MKRLKLLIGIAILIIAAFGISRMLHPDTDAEAAAAPQEMPPMPVPVIKVEEKPVQIWKDFPGRLQAVDSVDIRPQVSGTIKEIRFRDGQTVKAGDVLFVIDTRAYEADAAQARADLQSAKNQHELAQKELKRAEELIGTGAIPKRTYDERLSNELVAKSAIASAEARLKRAQLNLDYAHVKAPITGRISRAEITEGNLVEAGPGAPILTSIVSNEGIYADFEVDEQTYLLYVRNVVKSQEDEQKIPVKLFLQNAADTVFEGTIHSFDNKIDTASGTIRARAYFKNADAMLLPGMFVNVRLGSAESKLALTIPSRAVGTDQDRKFVYVVTPENKIQYREITLGESVNGSRIVTKGLSAGDVVVTDGIMKVQPEMTVVPQFAETETPEVTSLQVQDAPPAEVDAQDAKDLIPAEATPEEKITP
jgi:multidrug efflux system membrane fusion protein